MSPPDDANRPAAGFFRSRPGMVLIAFLVIAAYFLWTEHRAHTIGALPWLLLAACPLLHAFMHRGGHGGHHGGRDGGGW